MWGKWKENVRKCEAKAVDFCPRGLYNETIPNFDYRKETLMSLGNNLYRARKKSGLSQEEVAENLGVSRQTISKWELNETLPDIRQAKKLASLYRLSLDELIDFDVDRKEIQELIDKTDDKLTNKIDWTKTWSRKYPILSAYPDEVEVGPYAAEQSRLLEDLRKKYGYDEQNAVLVLKDILFHVFQKRRKTQGN